MNTNLEWLIENDGFICPACGKRHFGKLKDCIIGNGALLSLPTLIRKYGATKAYVLCDTDTEKAAGTKVAALLDEDGIAYELHAVRRHHPAPDEKIVGEALMYCPIECDIVVAVGGGVINDTGKIIAAAKKVPDIIVATAPSMDGFASATSSMERSGLKVSISSKCPDAVIGDSDILAAAPAHMIASGLGDMLAKYTSIAEWKIAHLLLGEYYCEFAANLVNEALNACVEAGEAAVHGDKDAVVKVMRGLVLAGLAMNYTGVSRPASGMEHYISHIIDMRALAFGTAWDLHGVQCALGTLLTVRAYEKLLTVTPDREKALAYVKAFEPETWNQHLREQLGEAAETIIAGEYKEKKYDVQKHFKRLECLLSHWDEICAIINTLPASEKLESFMKSVGLPTSGREIGVSDDEIHEAFMMAKDIRDKYVLGRMLWDLGLL